jgi:anti-sigma factor RsiW
MNIAFDDDGHTRAALPAYFADALTPADTDAVERHLAGCPACLAESQRIGALAEELSRLREADAE